MVAQLSKLSSLMANSVKLLEHAEDVSQKQLTALVSITEYFKGQAKKDAKDIKDEKSKAKPDTTQATAAGQFSMLAAGLKDISTSLPGLALGLMKFIPAPTTKFTNFIKELVGSLTMGGDLKNPSAISKMYESMSAVISTMGTSIGAISGGLMKFNIVAGNKAQDKFITFVKKLFSKELMTMLDPKKALVAAQALSLMGKAMFGFVLYGTLMLPFIAPALLGMFLFTKFLIPMAKELKKLKDVDFVGPVKELSVALLFMAGALLIMKAITLRDIGMAAASLGLLLIAAVAMSFIGKLGTPPKAIGQSLMFMALAVGAMGVAMLIFKVIDWQDYLKAAATMGLLLVVGAGLALIKMIGETPKTVGNTLLVMAAATMIMGISMLIFKVVAWEDIAKAGAVIGLLVISTMALAVGKMLGIDTQAGTKSILLLAASLAIMGVSMLIFKAIGWEDIEKAKAVIGGLGLAAVGLGAVAELAEAGAAVLATLSVVLLIFSAAMLIYSFSLKIFKGLNWKDEDSVSLAGAIAAPIRGLLGSMGGGEVKKGDGIFGKIGNALGGLVGGIANLVTVGLGIAMLLGLSVAIVVFSYGLSKFKAIGWTLDDTTSLAGAITGTIGASIGAIAPAKASSGFFGFVKDAIKSVGNTAEGFMGAKVLKSLGEALVPFTQGLLTFKMSGFKPEDTKNLSDIIISFIDSLKVTFSKMDKDTRKSIIEGATALSGIGTMMYSIATGVYMMSALKFKDASGKEVQLSPAHFKAAGENITAIFNAIKDPLAAIGKDIVVTVDKKWWGIKVTSNPAVANGIAALQGIGDLMKSIAEGVKSFAGIKDAPGLAKIAGATIKTIYDQFSKAFADIGKDQTVTFEDKWWGRKFKSSPTVAAGMQALSGMGSFIKSMAEAMKEFANVGDAVGISDKIGKSITGIMTNFSTGFSKVTATANSQAMDNFITGYKDFFKITNDFAGLVDPLERIANSFDKIGTSIVNMKDGINAIEIDKLSKSKEFMESIIQIDKINFSDFQDKMKSVKDAIETASKANVDRLDKLASTSNSGNGQLQQTMDAISQLLQSNNQIMTMVANKLSQTLRVDVVGDSNKY